MTKNEFIEKYVAGFSDNNIDEKFNWEWVDEFVNEHLNGMIHKHGLDFIKQEISNQSESTFLIYFVKIVEIGSLLALNQYEKDIDRNHPKNLYLIIGILVLCHNYFLGYYLKSENILEGESAFFFNEEANNVLCLRTLEYYNINHESQLGEGNDFYKFSSQTYLTYLLQFSRCENLRWIKPFNNIQEVISSFPDIWPEELKFQLAPFSFISDRYEVWENGQLIKSGKKQIKIESEVDSNKLMVQIFGFGDYDGIILKRFNFYVLKPSYERLLFVNIPLLKEYDLGILNRENLSYVPGPEMSLQKLQPYASSLFYHQNKLVKVTFSINDPAWLVEFYCQDSESLMHEPSDLAREIERYKAS